MRQNRNDVKTWRKITALLLPAWMLAACAPGKVYGAEVSANYDISAENVNAEAEAETEAETYAAVHRHIWKYELQGTDAVTVSCQGKTGNCSVGTDGMRLTLEVERESVYTSSSGKRRTAVVADNSQLDLNELGIVYRLTYYKDADGSPSGTSMSTEPKDAGVYHVKAAFGSGNSTVLEDTFTIKRAERTSSSGVKMDSYEYGSNEAAGPSLSGTAETIEYWYYRENEENPCKIQDGTESFDPKGLETGTYDVLAKYTRSGYRNYIYVTKKTRFQVEGGEEKADRWEIRVLMPSYDRKGGTPSPELNGELEDSAEIDYYYSRQNRNTGGTKWSGAKLPAGTYYMYAVIGETAVYGEYTTPVQQFTVYADHKWAGLPNKLASKVQARTIQCRYCGEKQTVRLPKKTVNVMMGNSVTIKSKGCTFTLRKSAKVKKKCFSLSKKGKISTKDRPACYKSMGTSVPVAVKVCGKSYSMNVKLKIPAPKVRIECEKKEGRTYSGYNFKFYYRVPGANRIQVRMDGESDDIKNHLKKEVSNPRPSKTPALALTNKTLARFNNRVTFRIRAYYGKNKSEILTVTKTVGSGGGGGHPGREFFD